MQTLIERERGREGEISKEMEVFTITWRKKAVAVQRLLPPKPALDGILYSLNFHFVKLQIYPFVSILSSTFLNI